VTKQYPCTCELRAFGDRHNATIDALLKCGMSYTEIMDKLGLVRFPNAIAMDHKCPRCQEAGMYDEEASNWTPEPWQAGREDAQSYYGDTGQPFSSVYRQDDDDRMPLTPDGFGGMTRVPLRIAYVEGKDIPRDEEKANARRIVACVNACKDLANPAAEIKAMREVCSAALRYRNGKYSGDCERQEQAWFDVVRALDDALAVLKALDAALAALKAPTSDGAGEGGGNAQA
jgi:hypothetical protein